MADLCKKCSIFDICLENNAFDECINDDYVCFAPKKTGCEGCFYENDLKNDILSPCKKCIRNPIEFREDLFISRETEKEKCNE